VKVRATNINKGDFIMGEYAIRKSDGQEIKIGTCSSMYYLRYEDRKKVTSLNGNVDPCKDMGLRFRIPFVDEDHILPGEYEPFRGASLYGFEDTDLSESVGNIQIKHESGLLVNVNCYHGEKLPEKGIDFNPFWNGKAGYFYELRFIKTTKSGIKPIIGCRYCSKMWCCDWSDIMPYITDVELKKRFYDYAGDEFYSNLMP
jgi:hypothetical protein